LMLLGFSLLNPHVYLDTVILLGSMGARHGTGRADFVIGVIMTVIAVNLGFYLYKIGSMSSMVGLRNSMHD